MRYKSRTGQKNYCDSPMSLIFFHVQCVSEQTFNDVFCLFSAFRMTPMVLEFIHLPGMMCFMYCLMVFIVTYVLFSVARVTCLVTV